eukprot:jgi/Botrbrau1/13478/Bobra.0082s0075.2
MTARDSQDQEPRCGSVQLPPALTSGGGASQYGKARRPRIRSPAAGALSRILALARSSEFAFASEELEADFQAYQAQALSLLSWLCASVTAFGYCVLLAKIMGSTAEQRALLPPLLRPLVFQFAPTVFTLALLTIFRGFYKAHQQAMHLGVQCCIFFAWHSSRQLVLWNLVVKGSNPGRSFMEAAQSFLDENIFSSAAWYAVPAFPTGQAGDLAITLAWLLANLVGNSAICASPLWPSNAVTLSSGPVEAVRRVSTWLRWGTTPVQILEPTPVLSCPENLVFWQVLGSWLACLAVCVGEVLRRRAFLRTPAAQARLGRQFAAAALQWPFGGVQLVVKCVCGLFLLTLGHCLVWAVAFDILSH